MTIPSFPLSSFFLSYLILIITSLYHFLSLSHTPLLPFHPFPLPFYLSFLMKSCIFILYSFYMPTITKHDEELNHRYHLLINVRLILHYSYLSIQTINPYFTIHYFTPSNIFFTRLLSTKSARI